MVGYILLISLAVILNLYLKKILDRRFFALSLTFAKAKEERDALLGENERLKNDNSLLEERAAETTALYDITKDICKPLDEDKVYAVLKSEMDKYIKTEDCKFLKSVEDLSAYANYTALPLSINKQPVGYLLASGVRGSDMDKFYILAHQFMLGIKRALLYKKVQELSIMDGLTSVFTRRYLMERFSEEIERSKKFSYKFSFLMADVDHFKGYNDRYGHLVGDAILKEVSRVIRENIRQIDLVGRYGGEEFSAILTETDREGARFAAERIRAAIEQKRILVYDEDLHITISIGISVFPEDSLDLQGLIEKADKALYQAKETGRNRVCIYRAGE
jgi:diguanylate cyclase (GGDEF)-like protein